VRRWGRLWGLGLWRGGGRGKRRFLAPLGMTIYAGFGGLFGFGGGREAVVIVAVDGFADRFAPVAGVERVDVFVLGDLDGLQEGLGHVGDGASDLGLYIAADNGGDEAAQGGAEIAGGEVVAGEVVG